MHMDGMVGIFFVMNPFCWPWLIASALAKLTWNEILLWTGACIATCILFGAAVALEDRERRRIAALNAEKAS